MQLNYKQYGDNGPKTIILHGLLGSLDNWQTIAKQLAAEGRTIFTLDQRNHGKSPHLPVMDYDVMAADLGDFMDQQGIESAQIVGHSMGGKTAMRFAQEYPERVDRLVIVDIAPKGYPPGHDDVFEALYAIDPETLNSRQEADDLMRQFIKSEGLRLFLLKNLTRDGDHYRWKMNLPVLYENYDNIREHFDVVGTFEKPVLFIKGSNSNYIEDRDMVLIQQIYPNAHIEIIEGAGHWVHADAPEPFYEVLHNFI